MARGARGLRRRRSGKLGRRGTRAIRRSRVVERQVAGGDQAARGGICRLRKGGQQGGCSPGRADALLGRDEPGSLLSRAGLVCNGRAAARGRGGVGGARPDRTHAGRHRDARGRELPAGDREPGSRLRACPSFRRPRYADASAGGEGTRSREERQDRSGARADHRGDRSGRQRRAAAVLDHARLLHDHQLLPGRR